MRKTKLKKYINYLENYLFLDIWIYRYLDSGTWGQARSIFWIVPDAFKL